MQSQTLQHILSLIKSKGIKRLRLSVSNDRLEMEFDDGTLLTVEIDQVGYDYPPELEIAVYSVNAGGNGWIE